MSITNSEENKVDRLTVRLPSRDLEQLRELARSRNTDVATLGRQAIRAFIEGQDPHATSAQFLHNLRSEMR